MEWTQAIFGKTEELTALQMTVRGLLAFVAALVMLRIAGKRTFGRQSASDNVIMIMLGAILSRAITGASAFLPVLAASLAIVLLHRLLTWISLGNPKTGAIIKGKAISLFKDGRHNKRNMLRTLVSHDDMMEGVRKEANSGSLDNIREIFIERNGSISVIKKQDI